jgi:hypothetical protein
MARLRERNCHVAGWLGHLQIEITLFGAMDFLMPIFMLIMSTLNKVLSKELSVHRSRKGNGGILNHSLAQAKTIHINPSHTTALLFCTLKYVVG